MSAHIGKIGRLSKSRREELGERMEDGHTGKELVEWLNSLPDMQALLKEKFGGLPVNEQNVSNWRQSGHLDWLRMREARARVLRLVSDAEELSAVAEGRRLGDCLAVILAVELDNLGRAWLEDAEADLGERWKRFCEVHRQVSRLRRDDDRVKRTELREKALEVRSSKSKVQSLNPKPEVQRPKSEVQSLGAVGGTPAESAGKEVCAAERAEVVERPANQGKTR
jgi:hypothetical protein